MKNDLVRKDLCRRFCPMLRELSASRMRMINKAGVPKHGTNDFNKFYDKY